MHSAAPSTDPDVESPREAYLRRVIERQPACLTRIAADGSFLAVNDAALSMLGAVELGAVLETSLLALVAPDHKEQCRAFLARIIAGDRGSAEVDLIGLGGLRYTLQIHAVSLRRVKDSLASALCTFWDVTQQRSLERALTEAAARGEQQAAALGALQAQRAAGAGSSSAIDQARLALEAALRESEQRRKTAAEQEAAHRAQLAVAAADRAALESDLCRLAAAMATGLHDALAAAAHRGSILASLSCGSASGPHADAPRAGALEGAEMVRRIRQINSGPESDAAAGRVVQTLEGAVGAVLSPGIALSVLVGSSDTRVGLTPDQLEQLLMTLVANRRATMRSGGHVSLEVADVDLDQTCARERGASPGAHVLLALHVSGPGVDTGLPAALFGAPADEKHWRAVGPGMAGLHQAVQAAGGHLWAMREGADTIALEVYLPSVTSGTPAASSESSR